MKRISGLGRLLNCNGEPASDSLIMRANAVDGLDAMTDLLYGPGQHMAGSDMSNEDAMTYAQNSFPFGNYCIVRDWIWIDLDVTDEQRSELAKTRRLPVILYAHGVVIDSERRWDVGDFVRTSPLHIFEEGFHFKTRHTVYLLLGAGTRKQASAETVARIF
jgi:hypothetical protein